MASITPAFRRLPDAASDETSGIGDDLRRAATQYARGVQLRLALTTPTAVQTAPGVPMSPAKSMAGKIQE
jgi:hypothetical protein